MVPLQKTVLLSILVGTTWCVEQSSFPSGFKFGAASSAYQIEGAWNASDKGVNIWDTFVHKNPNAISDSSTGDVACDSHNLWRKDVDMAAQLGLDFYRFSLSWSRILPSGYDNYINEDGKRYYSDLIDALLEKSIEPMITLYHWDLPQSLQDLGGWTNPHIVDCFADYARVVFTLFGDRVRTWLTINEPLIMCDMAYGTGILAPGIESITDMYLCNKNVLLAHARAWRVYDKEFREKHHGMVSIANHLVWVEGEDQSLADLVLQYANGRYTYPIFSKEGGWPPEVEKALTKSTNGGHTESKLPAFTDEEKEFVRGTYDFFGLNHYFSQTVRARRADEKAVIWPFQGAADFGIVMENPSGAETLYFGLAMWSKGLRRALKWVREQYGDVGILITEIGYPSYDPGHEDLGRLHFYQANLEQVLVAINEDCVNVTGFTAWSIMDNFEWSSGYTITFGLYHVDFSSPERTRTPRLSADFYTRLIRTRSLNTSLNDVP